MSDDKLPFSKPSIGEDEIREVVEVLRSGWITSGPRVKRFEADFAQYVGAQHAVSVTSCTAGLHLALLAHGIGPGDEVVTTAMTWPATVNMIELLGAKPVFAEIDRGTLEITPESVEAVLTEATRAILPVHFAGQAVDLDALAKIATRDDLVLIEDAAHAVGTEYKGRRIGSDGRTTCFSFHPIKNITTGEGGMVTTDDSALAERLRLLRFHGVNRDAWSRYAKMETVRDETLMPGFKYNLTDLQAALGIHQLARLDGFIERRAELASLYLETLADIDVVSTRTLAEGTTRHAWHLFVVTLELEKLRCDRDRFVELLGERGIGTGLHFTAVHLHRHYRERYGFEPGDLPETEWASDRVISLPLFPDMREADVARVCEALRDVAREVGR
ncbi:MAG: aminotransferase class I/II-fold pyridoxal phosphate-dependent enzyme [Myxococcales bacterium]|nr:aminotransferase class I/II-fold pyridoxal phosphate-dependent enzyme [Myxococcales bacterium]MDH5306451.1 aminotransferase class I/II-fold pyridoxal phosphate-dependent enzyme [Myxococcales bacterium]MDH5567306.1 aminotransferase class I/II-fold pyridoxal phosphate-dependent enzyme [Myxococcales bacterium]